MIRFSQLLIAVCACFSGAALAQHDGDIGLIIDAQKLSSVVITGGEYSENEQIFTASFGDSGFDYFTQNPGWNAAPGTFIPGTTFTWSAVSGLKVYEPGVGFVATSATLRVSFSTASVTIGSDPTAGFSLQVQPDGGFHKHPNFFLQGPNGSDPEPGAYLLETQLEISEPGVDASESVFVVYDNMASDLQIEAVGHLTEILDGPDCPSDIDQDGSVDFADVLTLLGDWACDSCPDSDVDNSGNVDFSDLLTVIANWGDC